MGYNGTSGVFGIYDDLERSFNLFNQQQDGLNPKLMVFHWDI